MTIRPLLRLRASTRISSTSSNTTLAPARIVQRNMARSTSTSTSAKILYASDPSLPNLPVPPVEQTSERYLATLKAFWPKGKDGSVSEDEKRSRKAVEEFKNSPLVAKLQKRLEDRASDPKSGGNWLADWWNFYAYLQPRDPLVPWVNYFYSHGPVPHTPPHPTFRAALLTKGILAFRKMVVTETLAPEVVGKGAKLDSSSYKYLFGAWRVPVKGGPDATGAGVVEGRQTVMVARGGEFFEVEVIDENGVELSAREIQDQFDKIVKEQGQKKSPTPVGALTTANRDHWAEAREELLKSPVNKESIAKLDKSLLVIVLDQDRPTTREQVSWGLWVGDGKNRWFDKHQLIIFDNGKTGFNGEHSMLDGTPTVRLNDFLLRSIDAKTLPLGNTRRSLSAPTKLSWDISPVAREQISKAEKDFTALMGKHQLSVLDYAGYGKPEIKSWKTSPDSWAQLVMQLGYWKLTAHKKAKALALEEKGLEEGEEAGELAGTYESCQTRRFKRGRTEVIRTASGEVREWVNSMGDINLSNSKKLELFRKAAAAHIKYASWAAEGQGVDRHLFGLRQLLEEGEETPDLYNDPYFEKSKKWVLSTSQLSSEYFEGWGYGEVVEDGYGLAYSVNERSLRFTITTMNGDAEVFRGFLEEAARETRAMVEGALKEEAEAAKPKL